MLVACVKTGNKYGPQYVTKLRDGIARRLPGEHKFVCFTDAPVDSVRCEPLPVNLPGWWAKIGLFRIGCPLIYFDLDVVITGDLSPLLDWQGFGIIKDWWQPGFNSSVMRLSNDEHHVWRLFERRVVQQMHGDQDWITKMLPGARTFPADWFPSYKANDCSAAVPPGAKAVIFHGHPKPHECGGWVAQQWV